MVEFLPSKQGVVGSNPIPATHSSGEDAVQFAASFRRAVVRRRRWSKQIEAGRQPMIIRGGDAI